METRCRDYRRKCQVKEDNSLSFQSRYVENIHETIMLYQKSWTICETFTFEYLVIKKYKWVKKIWLKQDLNQRPLANLAIGLPIVINSNDWDNIILSMLVPKTCQLYKSFKMPQHMREKKCNNEKDIASLHLTGYQLFELNHFGSCYIQRTHHHTHQTMKHQQTHHSLPWCQKTNWVSKTLCIHYIKWYVRNDQREILNNIN